MFLDLRPIHNGTPTNSRSCRILPENSTLQAVQQLIIELRNSLSDRRFVCIGCLSIVQKVVTA
jgi:hypothetical protein